MAVASHGRSGSGSPYALRAYADKAHAMGMDKEYCEQIMLLADRFELWRHDYHVGDPDAGPHREDNADIVSRIPRFATELPPV